MTGVTVMTAIVAMIAHIDGSGASTFCIVVPVLLPLYDRMKMRRTTLLRICLLAMGVMNLMPWAGPVMRAATILGMETGDLWRTIIPLRLTGMVLVMSSAARAGLQERKLGAFRVDGHQVLAETDSSDIPHPQLQVFNFILIVMVVVWLSLGIFPDYVPFMVGTAIALFANYGFRPVCGGDIRNYPYLSKSLTVFSIGGLNY